MWSYHYTMSTFMLISSSTKSHFLRLSQSHLVSFGSIASTSPLGSSVTLETHKSIIDRGTWVSKGQDAPNQPDRESIHRRYFNLPLRLNHCPRALTHTANITQLVQLVPNSDGCDAKLGAIILLIMGVETSAAIQLQRTGWCTDVQGFFNTVFLFKFLKVATNS